MSLSLIIQLIIAIPKIWGLIQGLISSIQNHNDQEANKKLKEGLDEGQAATSKEDKWKANEKVTSNLP